jgi:hypothetical protein
MSLEQLSNLAQIVGTVAVVASLIYVAIELRHNTAQLRRGEMNAAQQQWQAIRLTLATDRDVARVWTAGRRGDALDVIDALRFDMLIEDQTWAALQIWDRARRGVIEKTAFDTTTAAYMAQLLTSPGGAPWWQQPKPMFMPGFVAAIDKAIAARPRAVP